MTYWVLPWNSKIYDLSACLNKYDFVDWRQRNNFEIGDIIFVYCSLPVGRIVYMLEVIKINLKYKETVEDHEFFFSKEKIEETPPKGFARFKLVSIANTTDALSYARLHELGMIKNIQLPIRVTGNLLQHILSNFDINKDESTNVFQEGKAHIVEQTAYERNPIARYECILHKGCKCNICGFDFEKVYGDIGKDFIHVHHIDFICEKGGVNHKIDPIKDLIPVCPNCHAMLHKKINGKYCTVAELINRLHYC